MFKEAEGRKRPEGWGNKTWMLHHDNAHAHTSLLVSEFLTEHETTGVPQSPYSPDLAPAELFLFPRLKSALTGRRFQAIEQIEEKLLWDLRAIPQNALHN
jgi:transposase